MKFEIIKKNSRYDCSNIKYYSLLKASTGFLFAAALAGINPDINVKAILTTIIIIASLILNEAIVYIPANEPTIKIIILY